MFVTRRRLGVTTAAMVSTALTFACSSNTVTGGGLMVAFSSDMSIPKDVDTLHLEITQNGVTRFEQDYQVGPTPAQTLPATLLVLPPSEDPSAPVQIRVVGLQNGTPRVLRDAVTVVPGDRVAELRMPVAWLCEGSAESGPTSSDGTASYAPKLCTASDTTCAAGACISSLIDSTTLPRYDPTTIFGGASEAGAGGACFDTLACFATGALAPVDLGACTVPAPASGMPNVAIVVGRASAGTTGICGAEACLVPLDGNSSEGWQVASGKLQLPAAVCADIKNGQADGVLVATDCPTKTDTTPPCGAWSSAGAPSAVDAGQTIALTSDGGGDGGVDATLPEGDAAAPMDGAVSDGSTQDATLGDGGGKGPDGDSGGAPDAASGDASLVLVSSLSVAGTTGELYVLTSDDYATFTNGTLSGLWEVPLDGGPVATVSSMGTRFYGAQPSGRAVAWVTTAGDLEVWSAQYGLIPLEPSVDQFTLGASSDGTHVGYTYGDGGSTESAGVADLNGTNATTLDAGLYNLGVEYAGNTLIVASSTTPDAGLPDGAGAPGEQYVYAASSASQGVALPENYGWSLDANGDLAFVVIAGTGEGALYTIPGNVKTHVDANVRSGLLTPDGTGVVYATTSGALSYAAVTATPQPITLVPSGAAEVRALSPDGNTVAYCSATSGTGETESDLWVTSAKTAGTPKQVVSTTTVYGFGEYLGMPSFTADSSYVLFLTGTTYTTGTLSYAPVSTGVAVSLGTVAVEYAASQTLAPSAFLAPTGSILLYSDSTVLTVLDLATSAKATYNLFGPFQVTADGARVVFAGNNGSGYGLYSASLSP